MHNSEASRGAGPRGRSQQSPHDADPKSVSQAGTIYVYDIPIECRRKLKSITPPYAEY